MRNDIVTLINKAYTVDSIGQRVPTETNREVFCSIRSVSASEWFNAGQNNIKAALQILVDIDDYEGEKIARVDGIRYAVYRTYRTREGTVELYLEEKEGV